MKTNIRKSVIIVTSRWKTPIQVAPPLLIFRSSKNIRKSVLIPINDIFLGMCKPVQCLSLIFSYVILYIPKQWFTWGSRKFTKDCTSVILSLYLFSQLILGINTSSKLGFVSACNRLNLGRWLLEIVLHQG